MNLSPLTILAIVLSAAAYFRLSAAAYFRAISTGGHYHPGDQYHHYIVARYFREMRYDGLYKCAVIAKDELGTVSNEDESQGVKGTFDLTKEVHSPDEKIPMWLARCPGQIFTILLSQLTWYYFSFMILAAPLTRVGKSLNHAIDEGDEE